MMIVIATVTYFISGNTLSLPHYQLQTTKYLLFLLGLSHGKMTSLTSLVVTNVRL